MIEATIFARLSGLADGRVFWDVADQGTPVPYLVLTKVSGRRGMAFAGLTGERVYRLQVAAWGQAKMDAIALQEQAVSALCVVGADGLTVEAVDEMGDDYDETTSLHGVLNEFTIQP